MRFRRMRPSNILPQPPLAYICKRFKSLVVDTRQTIPHKFDALPRLWEAEKLFPEGAKARAICRAFVAFR